jgi:hypothetical protein
MFEPVKKVIEGMNSLHLTMKLEDFEQLTRLVEDLEAENAELRATLNKCHNFNNEEDVNGNAV